MVQAEYWQDPLNEDEYEEKCVFLPDINQMKVYGTLYSLSQFCPEYKYIQDALNFVPNINVEVFLPSLPPPFPPSLSSSQIMNSTYKQRVSALNNLVLVMFELDTMVQPKESEVCY